jgi:integrase
MENDQVALPTGVKPLNGVYQLRITIPKVLQPIYGKVSYRTSLFTSDRGEARLKALEIWALKEAEFQQKRRELAPLKLTSVPVGIRTLLAEAVYAAELARDAAERGDKVRTARMTAGAASGAGNFPVIPETSLLAPLSQEIIDKRAELNRRRAAFVVPAVESGNLLLILPIAQIQARRMCVDIQWDTADGAATLEACLHAYSRAKDVAVARDGGSVVVTPELPRVLQDSAAPTVPAAVVKAVKTLADVVPEWARFRRAKPNAIARTNYALRLFKESKHLEPLANITRAVGRDFHGWLTEDVQGISDKTAKNHFDCIRALLQVAAVELEWIGRNPWQGMELPVDDSLERPPWSPEDLATLFSTPVFQSYTLPSMARAGGPGAYWMPLLGLYSGARVGELGQLEVADILNDKEGHWVSIHKRVPGSVLKTKNSERVIAIHPELMRLGFLDYVQDLRDAGAIKLFPILPRTASRSRGANFSQWFGEFRRASGITDRYPDFHSLRHNARQSMRDAGIDSRLADAVTGHASKGGTGDVVYARSVAPERKRFAVQGINYPDLKLPRVYPQPPKAPIAP